MPSFRASCPFRPNEKQLLCNMIYDASEVVNRVASDTRDTVGNGISSGYVIDQLSGLRIALGSDFVWLGIKKGFQSSVKVTDVLFGPFNFYLDERNPFIGSHGFSFLKKRAA